MASRIAPASATHRVRTARRLVHDMPETLDALAHAVIDPEKARAISRSAAPLDPAQRRLVDRALGSRMPDLAGAGQEQVCREVEALAQAIDPDGKERRHQQAKRGRGVKIGRASCRERVESTGEGEGVQKKWEKGAGWREGGVKRR